MKQLAGKQVLLADDEFAVRLSLAMMLDAAGANVVAAEDGDKALELFRTGQYDCVVTDYNMPGLKGDVLAHAIKTTHPKQRVVMVSAFAESALVNGELPWFIDALVHKPCRMRELLAAVHPPSDIKPENATPAVPFH